MVAFKDKGHIVAASSCPVERESEATRLAAELNQERKTRPLCLRREPRSTHFFGRHLKQLGQWDITFQVISGMAKSRRKRCNKRCSLSCDWVSMQQRFPGGDRVLRSRGSRSRVTIFSRSRRPEARCKNSKL